MKLMPTQRWIDVIEPLLRVAAHPDFTDVTRYGTDDPGGHRPMGVKGRHLSGSQSLLWAAVPPADAIPLPVTLPDSELAYGQVRVLLLLHRLLEAARPAGIAGWEICATPGVRDGRTQASAMRITDSNGAIAYVRATGISASGGRAVEPAGDPCPTYQIPQEVLSWHHNPDARPAEVASV
jgi:hypothetical protein